MKEIGSDAKNPNFLMVVMVSAAALIVIFICAYFLLGDKGRKLLPSLHPDPHPTSYLAQPAAAATKA